MGGQGDSISVLFCMDGYFGFFLWDGGGSHLCFLLHGWGGRGGEPSSFVLMNRIGWGGGGIG